MYTIYLHTNTANNKRYVGLTKLSMAERWKQHEYQALNRKKGCPIFFAAIRKYGSDAFTHEVLEETDTLGAASDAEQWWIAHFCSDDRRFGYNMELGGSAPMSAETRAKMSASRKGHPTSPETRKKIGEANKKQSAESREKGRQARIGMKRSEETRATMKAAYAARPNKSFSDAHRAKISAAGLGRKMSDEAIEKSRRARVGAKRSEEAKARIREGIARRKALNSVA